MLNLHQEAGFESRGVLLFKTLLARGRCAVGKGILLAAGLGGILVLTQVPALAQGTSGVRLGEVVVTATRTEVPLEELGVSATVISAEEIRQRQATDLLELLRDVSGLTVVQSGSRGAVTELYSRGTESNHTLVLIDGVRVNEAGGGFDWSSLTTDNVERIEVIRGPQSALYGSDAMGGVIHIITKKGKGAPSVIVSTAHGGHSETGRYMGEQKVSLSGGSEWAGYSLSFGRIDDLGILPVNNDYWNNTFSGRLDLYPTDKLDVTLTARATQNRFGIPTENGGDIPDRVFPGLDPDQYQERLDFVGGLGAKLQLFPWWEHVIQAGLHRLDQEFRDRPDLETAFDAPPGSRTKSLETRAAFDYHTNFKFPSQGPLRSTLTLGYAFDHESLDLDALSTFRFGPPPFGIFTSTEKIEATRSNHAYYMQEQLTILERLHLTGGFRLEDNSNFGTELNPRGSIAYELKETGTKLRAALGTGIKEPTFLENFGGFGTIGNPVLKPEKSFSWEVGVDQYFLDKKLMLGVTYFRNHLEDLIAFVPTPFPPPPVLPPNYFNIQEAKTWGVELAAKLRVMEGLTVGGTYTFLDTEVLDDGGLGNLFFAKGKELLRRPNHTGSFFVNWLWRGFNLNLRGSYMGPRDDTFFTVSPGAFGFYNFLNQRVTNQDYFVLDVALSYSLDLGQAPFRSVRFFAKGRNILNENYEEVYGYSAPRASAMGGVELLF